MATCSKCRKPGLVEAVRGDQSTVLLDPHANCYVAVDEHQVYPDDGSRVFLTTALVEHKAVCPSERREQAQAREQGKAQYDRQKQAKAGR